MEHVESYIAKLKESRSNFERLYIYGAGQIGHIVYRLLVNEGVEIDGFIETTVTYKIDKVSGKPVYVASEILQTNCIVIIGVNERNQKTILEYLTSQGMDMSRVFLAGSIIGSSAGRYTDADTPLVDFTLKIGCSVSCRYCPQQLLLNRYFKDDPNRKSMMTVEDFGFFLNRIPEHAVVRFAGMSEPFLNPHCIEMLKLSCEKGRRTELYTTLEGADIDTIKRLITLPLSWVVLHLADNKQYARIPVNDIYLQKVETVLQAKKMNGDRFIDECSAQTEPDIKVKEIVGKNYIISIDMTDRAGNLTDEKLIAKKELSGKLSCSISGTNQNELLPDGSLYLCCMDYGLRHPLGNMFKQTYQSIMQGEQRKRIIQTMTNNCYKDDFLLCRNCSYACVN